MYKLMKVCISILYFIFKHILSIMMYSNTGITILSNIFAPGCIKKLLFGLLEWVKIWSQSLQDVVSMLCEL